MPQSNEQDHFNESQQRRVLASISYIDKLLNDVEEILSAASSQAFPKYKSPLNPAQVRVARDYMMRLRSQMVNVLSSLGIDLPEAKFDSTHSIRVSLQFIEVATEEIAPEKLKGYGEVAGELAARLAGGLREMKGIVRQFDAYLIQRPDADLSERVARLSETGFLSQVTGLIDRYGLVEFRSPLARIVDKIENPAYEIAFFGRVSAGKSSLLNRIVGHALLPTGVTPITAVPARIRNRSESALYVWTGDGRMSRYGIERIADFVTEARNPANEKRVTRVVADLPLANLPPEVVLVDTPGLGSLALEGAAETMAYLPQCDLGVVLVDASSNLHTDDLTTLDALRSAAVPGIVVLSKADLLSVEDSNQLVDYTRRKIEEQLGAAADVAPLSSRPEHLGLLELWIAQTLQPRIADARRLARESNRRKAVHLAERVLHALEMLARKTSSSRETSLEPTMRRAGDRLREAAGLVERTSEQCYRLTAEIRAAAPIAIASTAGTALDYWSSPGSAGELDASWIPKQVRLVAQNQAQLLAAKIQTTARTLSAALHQAADATSSSSSIESPSLESLVKDLPVADFSSCDLSLKKPHTLALSSNLARHALISRLERRCGDSIATFFNAYGRALELWFRNTLLTLDQEFTSSAEVYRAQLQRLSSDAPTGAAANGTPIASDIEALRQSLHAQSE